MHTQRRTRTPTLPAMPPLRRSARTASRRGKVVAVSGARQEDGGHAIHPGIASRSPRFNVHATHVHARHGQQLRQSARSSMTYAPGSVATTTETIPEYAPSIPIPLMSMQGDDAYMEDDRIHCSAADDPLYSSCTMMPMKVVEDMACTAYAHAPAYALLAPPPSNLISPSVASSQEQQQQQHATTFFQQSPPETPSMLFGAVTTPPSTSSSSLSAPFLDFPPLPTKFDCRSPNVLRTPPQTPASLQPAEYGSHSAFPYVATLQPTAQLIRAISLEHETIVDSGYLQHQRIKPEHRRHWFHWFTQVAIDMDYHPETACVALNFFDRYLADNRIVQQRQFHLLSITCLFVAAKMEEEILEPLCSDMLKHVGMPTTGKELRVWRLSCCVLTMLLIVLSRRCSPSTPAHGEEIVGSARMETGRGDTAGHHI